MTRQRQQQDQKLLHFLMEIGEELLSTTDLQELLDKILRVSREVFHFENAIIRLLSEDRQRLETAASYGYSPAAVAREVTVGRGIMGRVAATGEPLLVGDLAASEDYVEGISGARSELAVPLIARNEVIGVFNVESPQPGAFREEDVTPLLAMARQAAIAIVNARLYRNLTTVSQRYQQLNQLNSRILKSVNLGIYTVDSDLVITSWNSKIEELSGVTEEEALGQNLLQLFPRLEEEGIAERIRTVLRTGKAGKLRLAHRNLRGELRFQKRRLAPLREGGQVTGVVVIVEDITEFRRLLDQMIQSEKLAEVGRLSAGIGHELNNPLAVLAYATQLLAREESLSPFQQDLVERIDGEVGRLRTLTGSLLSFSRPQQGLRQPVDVNEVLQDVLRLVRYELASNSIAVVEDYGPLPQVAADSNKLKQVFINLLMNAAQAIGREGTIRVSSRPTPDGGVEVCVADDGPGMPPEVRAQIFEPFFTTKREGEGTGLGLYICRNLIAEHDGELTVESSPGAGTVFRIVLPAGEGVPVE